MPTRCFLISPTQEQRVYHRRYAIVPEDAPHYHNARTLVRVETGADLPCVSLWSSPEDVIAKATGDWPARCERCDYVFRPEDAWQLFVERVYAAEDGRRFSLREAPPGAIYHASWYDGRVSSRAPDGRNLMIVCPDGSEWHVDGPASNGPGWTRTGVPPRLTVTPSIQTGGYHGWLVDGVFTDDDSGRSYDAAALWPRVPVQ